MRVSYKLIQELAVYRQLTSSQPESGGVLLGRHLNTNGAILIDNHTRPQKSDIQGRCEFYRSIEHNRLVKQIWKRSKGHITYIGLWHTHPEPKPTPSQLDIKDWSLALTKSHFEGSFLFFFIVGKTNLRCWVGNEHGSEESIRFSGEYKYGKS